ncbi:heliorhodopsin HeR [Salinarchaeum sp. Harcht-Bsk1]|uniref:heliorhodopsin HeR n=1 Tax=Salinarchaeum sp. Harcht-Bsk1 TaxID=1333523 RepID=UPI0016514A38|nr:heliorhodopsin HeR [Salinarchaeum sp. Harcht-Bsk1]
MASRETTATTPGESQSSAERDGPLTAAPRYRRLRRWNAVMAVLHFVQGAAMLALADYVDWPVTYTRYEFDEATETLAPIAADWAEVPLPLLVAGFLFLSALAHATIATVRYEQYVHYLERGMNPYRWYEYSVSASVMIVVIGMLSGIWDLGALLALFGLTAVMNLCGLLMEQRNEDRERIDWTPYWVGVLAGIVPWIVIAITFGGTVLAAGGDFPEFVIYIYVSIFVFFNLFAVNMVLQYRETWRWKEYLFGERMYVLLSLVAKSLLAWQVYFGTINSPI